MTASGFIIGNRRIGDGEPAFLISEIAQAHDGSLGMAHAMIDAAADSGADAVKFQTHFAAAESTLDEPFRVRGSGQDASRYAYWKRTEFSPDQWSELASHAGKRNLIFLSSAFSEEAMSLLARIGMPAWKIASGELGSDSMLNTMMATRAPFIVSTGMSGWNEIETLVSRLRAAKTNFAILQCTSRYPTALEDVGLNVLDELRSRFSCPVGLSDHSGKVFPALAALNTGASIIEFHLALDRGMYGFDVSSSLTPAEIRLVAQARDAFAVMARNPVDKDKMARELAPMRAMFGRSLAPRNDLKKGTRLERHLLTEKKPGGGIPMVDIDTVVGRILTRDVPADRLLKLDDLG
jgi:N,N'-diacetyllegionaminate synthase